MGMDVNGVVKNDNCLSLHSEREAEKGGGDGSKSAQSRTDESKSKRRKMIVIGISSLVASVAVAATIAGIVTFSNKKSLSAPDINFDEEPISSAASETISNTAQCKSWCHSPKHANTSWAVKCEWKNCKGCNDCINSEGEHGREGENDEAQVFFTDVTLQVNSPSNNWDGDDMKHSFRPGEKHHPASFPDWDSDGFPDYFYSNHYQMNYSTDFDFGLSRLVDTDNPSGTSIGRTFHSIGRETFIATDEQSMFHDCHGATFADLDGDGALDLIISVGGGWGAGGGGFNDNLLFWGSSRTQGDTLPRLAGGREAARAAGVECANCRGRFMLITDANRDGKLDIFPISDVRVDDLLTPTPLLLNNGNRTFSSHLEMKEFTRTILLTDADGDGHAQEYMVFRATCFRDPSFGEHPDSHHEFCGSRPEKTTAIYKFDHEKKQMVMISPSYYRSQENQVYTPWNNEAAIDAITGDFDFDQKADQIVLFLDKLVFYYSSDRSAEQLPLYNEELGQSGSSEMKVPCSESAVAIRSADIDNDGQVELIIMCKTPGEIFVLSLQDPKSWTVNDWALGDLHRATGWGPEPRDIELACDGGDTLREKYWETVCRNPNYMPKMHGFQLIDLNNDGFLDAVLASAVGYQRFFLNNPDASKGNKFIRVELKSTLSNVYSIGATLIFRASGLAPQLREISSFGHGHARSGGVDDRIVFGLGQSAVPVSLTVRWPSMKEDFISLTDLDVGHISNYSNPIVVTER